ncbi:MAG: chemotaxis protein CheW [Bacillota bacterium]
MARYRSELMEKEHDDAQHHRYLTFWVEKEIFGVDLLQVSEILEMRPITELPETPDFIRGMIKLRSQMIPVIDLRIKFAKKSAQYDDRTCIVVVKTKEITVGLIVDRVLDAITILPEDIVPPPQYGVDGQSQYISGVAKSKEQISILLCSERLFREDEMSNIKNICMSGERDEYEAV